jgi:hypothetical protein
LVRAACGQIAAASCIRILALVDSKTSISELAELQTAFAKEAEEPLLLYALRGERAVWHLTLENIDNGKLQEYELSQGATRVKRGVQDRVESWLLQGFDPGRQAKFLELMSKSIVAAKFPPHKQLEAIRQVERELKSLRSTLWESFRYYRIGFLFPATELLTEKSLRSRAELVTAVAAIACERFRLSQGRWPTSLNEIPKELLPAIPTDPFNGEPIRLAKQPDGIVVFSVGLEESKDAFDKKPHIGPLGGQEVGWQLYDPEHRGLPALPYMPRPKAEPKSDENEP